MRLRASRFSIPAELKFWSTLQRAHLFSWSYVHVYLWQIRSHLFELVNQTPTTIRKTRAASASTWHDEIVSATAPQSTNAVTQGHIIGHIHPNRQPSLHLQSTLKDTRRRKATTIHTWSNLSFQKCQESMFPWCQSRQQDDCRVVYISVYTYCRKRGRLHPSTVINYIDEWQRSILKSPEFYEENAAPGLKRKNYFYNIDLQGRIFLGTGSKIYQVT
jgi:hypothetical protein